MVFESPELFQTAALIAKLVGDAKLPALSERTPEELDALRRRIEGDRIEGDPQWRRVFSEDGVYVFSRAG